MPGGRCWAICERSILSRGTYQRGGADIGMEQSQKEFYKMRLVVCLFSLFLHWARDWRALALTQGLHSSDVLCS